MRTATLTLFALLALTTEIAQAGPFNQSCLDNEAIMTSVQTTSENKLRFGDRGQLSDEDVSQIASVQPQASCARLGDRGQLSEDDISQIASVQPSSVEPLKPILLTGVRGHRGQLGEEDIAQIRSVRPVGAIMLPAGYN